MNSFLSTFFYLVSGKKIVVSLGYEQLKSQGHPRLAQLIFSQPHLLIGLISIIKTSASSVDCLTIILFTQKFGRQH